MNELETMKANFKANEEKYKEAQNEYAKDYRVLTLNIEHQKLSKEDTSLSEIINTKQNQITQFYTKGLGNSLYYRSKKYTSIRPEVLEAITTVTGVAVSNLIPSDIEHMVWNFIYKETEIQAATQKSRRKEISDRLSAIYQEQQKIEAGYELQKLLQRSYDIARDIEKYQKENPKGDRNKLETQRKKVADSSDAIKVEADKKLSAYFSEAKT